MNEKWKKVYNGSTGPVKRKRDIAVLFAAVHRKTSKPIVYQQADSFKKI